MTAAYTRDQMDAARAGAEPLAARLDALHAEATAALAYSANTLRSVRDRYRGLYAEQLARWDSLRDDVAADDRRPLASRAPGADAATAAEAGAEDLRRRAARGDLSAVEGELAGRRADLARLEAAIQNLEATWLLLERGDSTLVAGDGPASPVVQMRIVEAQEAERSRLAQEVHDGPAQALANAIFQVEYIERVLGQDPRLAEGELRFLRELLRRELGEVRGFISQLRPPVLDRLGLDGALRDIASHTSTLLGIPVNLHLEAAGDGLREAEQTVVLRVVQEALQNVRKHASASMASVTTATEDGAFVVEVRDDGRGFEVGTVAARGRRNFGLQFMRERAELIGARLDVRSRPDGGTVVRLAISVGGEEGR